MNTSVRRLAPALLVLLVSTPALAQPGALSEGDAEMPPPPPAEGTIVTIQADASVNQPAPPPVRAVVAPMNEHWGNVSHINGHPVKVGERGDYLHKWKKTNIATNPIGWMFGFYGVSVAHAMSDNITIRGDANVFEIDDTSGYELGLTVPIYFKRVFQGPFIEPGVMIRDFGDDQDCDWDGNCTEAKPSLGPQVMFGWHWTFDSGMNVALAMGAMRNMNKSGENNDNVEPAGYFRIGYAY